MPMLQAFNCSILSKKVDTPDYGAPKAYNDYPVLGPRRRLGVAGLRLLFLK